MFEELSDWRKLVRTLNALSEEQVLALLTHERANKRRVSFLERLHQRYSSLRVSRERVEILREGLR